MGLARDMRIGMVSKRVWCSNECVLATCNILPTIHNLRDVSDLMPIKGIQLQNYQHDDKKTPTWRNAPVCKCTFSLISSNTCTSQHESTMRLTCLVECGAASLGKNDAHSRAIDITIANNTVESACGVQLWAQTIWIMHSVMQASVPSRWQSLSSSVAT